MKLSINAFVLLSISITFVAPWWLQRCFRSDCLRFKSHQIRESAPTREDRLRAAIAFSLERRGLSPGILNRIAANPHRTQNDRGEQFIENGFFTGEWKALHFAFRRNARTETFFAIIDRYESSIAALQGGNDGPIKRKQYGQDVELSLGTSPVNEVMIYIHANGYVEELNLEGIHDSDILDLSYLPKGLLELGLSYGTLTSFDHLRKLPRGLEGLSLKGNRITRMVVESLPTLKFLNLDGNPLEKDGVTLTWPLPFDFTICSKGSGINAINLNGGEKHHVPQRLPGPGIRFDQEHWEITWNDFEYKRDGRVIRDGPMRVRVSLN